VSWARRDSQVCNLAVVAELLNERIGIVISQSFARRSLRSNPVSRRKTSREAGRPLPFLMSAREQLLPGQFKDRIVAIQSLERKRSWAFKRKRVIEVLPNFL